MKTRYDEYSFYKSSNSVEKTPCLVFQNVVRTLECKSDSANWHEELELQYIINGTGFVLIDGEKYTVTAGDIIIVNSHSVHYTSTDSKIKYTAVIISSDFCKNAEIDYNSLKFKPIISNQYLAQLFNDVIDVHNSKNQNYMKAKIQISLLRLLIEICEKHTCSCDKNQSYANSFKQIKTTIQYIRKNYCDKISLETLSANAYTNKYTLARNFKALTGQTVIEYINNFRCERAKDYLRNGLSVNETATLCGFNNMSFFTKTFKRFTGHLPTHYKN